MCFQELFDLSFIMWQRFFKLEIMEWKFPEIQIRIVGRMESAPNFHMKGLETRKRIRIHLLERQY